MFDKQIIDDILEAWLADQSHPHRGRAQRPLPDPADLKSIMETVFLASIQREEEKPITVSITLLPRDFSDEANRYSGRKLIVHFSEAIPFSVQSIKKVAPAFNAVVSSLLVAPKNLPRDYEIWGAMFFRPPINSFYDIAVGTGYEFFRADALTVTAVSPGSLIISRGDSVIGRFLSGKFEKAVPTPFIQEAMGKHIFKKLLSYCGGLYFKKKRGGVLN